MYNNEQEKTWYEGLKTDAISSGRINDTQLIHVIIECLFQQKKRGFFWGFSDDNGSVFKSRKELSLDKYNVFNWCDECKAERDNWLKLLVPWLIQPTANNRQRQYKESDNVLAFVLKCFYYRKVLLDRLYSRQNVFGIEELPEFHKAGRMLRQAQTITFTIDPRESPRGIVSFVSSVCIQGNNRNNATLTNRPDLGFYLSCRELLGYDCPDVCQIVFDGTSPKFEQVRRLLLARVEQFLNGIEKQRYKENYWVKPFADDCKELYWWLSKDNPKTFLIDGRFNDSEQYKDFVCDLLGFVREGEKRPVWLDAFRGYLQLTEPTQA